eukprot:TRINITY_DN10507_c0_g2_i1.p1 TRINITY_DN10507_c0_g2~~TRINITY_DN10507_c0_g2_i1.p1  ORF type:complete len:332 (+),score=95.65 TRINITY_DN10507_c0_g2_i1:37-996(+)
MSNAHYYNTMGTIIIDQYTTTTSPKISIPRAIIPSRKREEERDRTSTSTIHSPPEDHEASKHESPRGYGSSGKSSFASSYLDYRKRTSSVQSRDNDNHLLLTPPDLFSKSLPSSQTFISSRASPSSSSSSSSASSLSSSSSSSSSSSCNHHPHHYDEPSLSVWDQAAAVLNYTGKAAAVSTSTTPTTTATPTTTMTTTNTRTRLSRSNSGGNVHLNSCPPHPSAKNSSQNNSGHASHHHHHHHHSSIDEHHTDDSLSASPSASLLGTSSDHYWSGSCPMLSTRVKPATPRPLTASTDEMSQHHLHHDTHDHSDDDGPVV